jgi:two-component system response regulator NreC
VGVFVIPIHGLWIQSDRNRDSSGFTALLNELSSRSRIATDGTNQSTISGNKRQHNTLSVRQTDVLRLLAHGESTKEVAAILGISVKTVETYKSRIMYKLNASSVAELVQYAVRHHVIDLGN